MNSPYVTGLETRVKYLETQVGESEATIFQLRTKIARLGEELVAAQAQLDANNSASSSTISTHPSQSSDAKSSGSTATSAEQQHDARSAALQTLRTGLDSVSDPPPAPHPDDLLDSELERKVGGVFRMPSQFLANCNHPLHTDESIGGEYTARIHWEEQLRSAP